ERYVSRGEKAVPVRELPERGEGPVQGLAPQAHHLHVGGGFDESTGLRLRRLLEDDAFGDYLMEVAYGPIEQAQGFGALAAVFGQQWRIGMQAFDVVDDGPEPR